MALLSISEVAHRMELRTSAIRYYEESGILPPAIRIGGQRRYDQAALYRLAVVQRARQAGFRLDEIRTLFFGFQDGTRAEARWRQMANRKLAELEALVEQIKAMQALLERMKTKCRCTTLEMCGKGILASGVSPLQRPTMPIRQARRA